MPLVAPPPEARFWGSRPEDGPDGARFCLFGAPLDLTGSGRLGTGKAPAGVRRASHNIESYSPILDADLFDASLADLGDLDLAGLPMDAALAEIERQTAAILRCSTGAMNCAPTGPNLVGAQFIAPPGDSLPSPIPIVVGGEHTIALAIGRAIKKRHPDAVIISLDAHLDLADELDGRKIAHGTWACRLGEELGGYEDFVMLGMRSGTKDEWERSKRCMWQSPDVTIPEPLGHLLGDRPVYLSVDIDVLDPSAAPGTGTPEPPGISTATLFSFLYSMRAFNVVALDVNEILPEVDPAGITALTGAKLIREAVLLLSR
ncbi:MAG: arginase family protein [Chloroflexota bacterium]